MASSKDKLKKIIRELLDEVMNETSTSAGAGGFMTPNAFTGGKSANEKKRKKVATMFGMKLAPTKKNKKEDKAGLMEHISDNELQAGYVTRKAFSGNSVAEKKRAVERSTVLGYQLMQSKKNEEFFNFEGDDLLNEELIEEDTQINRDLELDLPDAKNQIKVDLPENEGSGTSYQGFDICKTSDGKFYSPELDDHQSHSSIQDIKDAIDTHIEMINQEEDATDPYAKAEREERDSMNGIREAEIIRKVPIDPTTKLPVVSKTADDMANLKPTQKGRVGGKDVVIDTDKDGKKIAQQVKIVSQK